MIKKRKVTTTYEYDENGILLKKIVVEETEEGEIPVINNLQEISSDSTGTPPSYLKATPVEYSDSTKVYYTPDGLESILVRHNRMEG